jgi:hypothetical protein
MIKNRASKRVAKDYENEKCKLQNEKCRRRFRHFDFFILHFSFCIVFQALNYRAAV